MNLFYLDKDHATNAQYHVDKHVVKMILEAAQLLCTTYQLQGIEAPYRKTHASHPTSIWVRNSRENFIWCVHYAIYLNCEKVYRYGTPHKSIDVINWAYSNLDKLDFPESGFTPFALAMPEQYRQACPIESYRSYYNHEKRDLFSWKNRNKPNWITNEIQTICH